MNNYDPAVQIAESVRQGSPLGVDALHVVSPRVAHVCRFFYFFYFFFVFRVRVVTASAVLALLFVAFFSPLSLKCLLATTLLPLLLSLLPPPPPPKYLINRVRERWTSIETPPPQHPTPAAFVVQSAHRPVNKGKSQTRRNSSTNILTKSASNRL